MHSGAGVDSAMGWLGAGIVYALSAGAPAGIGVIIVYGTGVPIGVGLDPGAVAFPIGPGVVGEPDDPADGAPGEPVGDALVPGGFAFPVCPGIEGEPEDPGRGTLGAGVDPWAPWDKFGKGELGEEPPEQALKSAGRTRSAQN